MKSLYRLTVPSFIRRQTRAEEAFSIRHKLKIELCLRQEENENVKLCCMAVRGSIFAAQIIKDV